MKNQFVCVSLLFFCSLSAISQRIIDIQSFINMCFAERNIISVAQLKKKNYELNYQIFKSSISPSISVALNGPSYTNKISPITQPDGSVNNIVVKNLNSSIGVNVNIPINIIGGSLSFQSNISGYGYYKDDYVRKNFSVDYFDISIRQPLSFFQENRWNNKISIADYNESIIKVNESIFQEKTNIINIFFEILICKNKIKEAEQQIVIYDTLIKRVKQEIDLGRRLIEEKYELELKKQELNIEIELQKQKYNNYIYSVLNDNVIEYSDSLVCPKIPNIVINENDLEYKITQKIEQKHLVSKLNILKSRTKLKRNILSSTYISVSMGISSSSPDINQLNDMKVSNYASGINATITLSNISTNKKEKQRNELQNIIEENAIQEEIKQQKVKLYNNINQLSIQRERMNILSLKSTLLTDKLRKQIDKYAMHRILIDDINDTLDKILLNEINKISAIKEMFLTLCNIEYQTSVSIF